jgi:predicted secreted hydrolase
MSLARLIIAATFIAGLCLTYMVGRPKMQSPAHKGELAMALNTNHLGYRQADRARRFRLPSDYGAHPRFAHEWWYFTGNLETHSGRRFGYELTIFRFALSPKPLVHESAWQTNQLYTAHLALTDAKAKRFYFHQRFSRGALGLAGARAAPFKIWVEDWAVSANAGGRFPWRLQAAVGPMALDIKVSPVKPLVLQGDRGLDLKSAQGDASYYYSYTRLKTAGHLRLGSTRFTVSGLSWLDREWSSGALAKYQTGWDWFALQFDNGADLMFYRLRKQAGATDPYSGGVWVGSGGATASLAYNDVVIKAMDYWNSPRGGRYPARWRLAVPARDCRFTVAPIFANQELNVWVRYWEGAVNVKGTCGERAVSGRGYVELTGYAGAL